MKVTKLPDSIDPNILMKEEIERRNFTCPFCGETERFDLVKYLKRESSAKGVRKQMFNKEWYGNKYEYKHPFIGWFAFWERSYYWTVDYYECITCGAEWESDPYPEIKIGGN